MLIYMTAGRLVGLKGRERLKLRERVGLEGRLEDHTFYSNQTGFQLISIGTESELLVKGRMYGTE